MFKNPVIDRLFFGASIIGGWFLFGVFVWAFFFHQQPVSWITSVAYICGFLMALAVFLLTLVGWRYVLTGNEFPND